MNVAIDYDHICGKGVILQVGWLRGGLHGDVERADLPTIRTVEIDIRLTKRRTDYVDPGLFA